VARGVEQERRDLDRGDAVDQRVVGLPDHRPAVAAQTADEIDAPQRVGRVQRLREQRPGEVAKLAHARRRSQRDRVHVAGDVEARVVGPVRVAEAEARAHDAPAKARHVLQPPLDVAAQRRQRRRAAGDADRPSDVQRCLRAVEIEEGGVQAAQAVDRRHAGMIPRVTGAPSVDFVARRADPDRVRRLFELVEEALRSRAPAQGDALVATLREHVSAWQPHLLDGVNPLLPGAGAAWDAARAEAYAPTERAGAVHLELGTWSAFPDERTQELIEADGLAELIRLDADPSFPVDVVADATALPFATGVLDRVGSNSVLEHIAYPHQVLAECHRVLRPGGVMVHVMPFVWWLHGYPDDYVRLTPPFFERVCREIGFVEVVTDVDATGGLYNTLHNASKMGAVDASRPEAEAMRELHELVALLLGALVPFDRAFEGGARNWFHSVRVLARKAGDYEPSRRTRGDGAFADRALDLLADPATKAPLSQRRGQLVSAASGVAYPVRRGVPDFLQPGPVRRFRLR
jgi:SAM-dependent methyltransferase